MKFGVWKGETVNLIVAAFPEKIIYGFDSFEGLPEDWRYDSRFDLQKGAFNVNGLTNILIILAGKRASTKLLRSSSKKIIWSLNILPAPNMNRLRSR